MPPVGEAPGYDGGQGYNSIEKRGSACTFLMARWAHERFGISNPSQRARLFGLRSALEAKHNLTSSEPVQIGALKRISILPLHFSPIVTAVNFREMEFRRLSSVSR
jgi:hypothetical protein